MKTNPKKLADNLLKNLIRETEDAVELVGSLLDQADSDGDETTASLLRVVRGRLDHASDELKTAESFVRGRIRSPRSPRPVKKPPLPV
jgi:hypothetical protein